MLSTMLNDLFKPAPDIWYNNCVERTLKQLTLGWNRLNEP